MAEKSHSPRVGIVLWVGMGGGAVPYVGPSHSGLAYLYDVLRCVAMTMFGMIVNSFDSLLQCMEQ